MKLTACTSAIFLMAFSIVGQANDQMSAEINANVWNLISRTVVENDISGMANAYHPDAVLVTQKGTFPISSTLERWGKGMEEIITAGSSADVSFRFTRRIDNAETAFESGMFRYVLTDSDGEEQVSIFAFEALLIKKEGQWKILMERQIKEVGEKEWSAQ